MVHIYSPDNRCDLVKACFNCDILFEQFEDHEHEGSGLGYCRYQKETTSKVCHAH